jgi:CRP-like cAMP-binding protein
MVVAIEPGAIMIKLELFKNETHCDEFRRGQTIFSEGERGASMYVVLEGDVTLSVKGKEVEQLGPGGVLGEMALLDAEPRSATAIAAADCKLVPIDQKRFTFLVQQTPHFALQIMRVIADRLRRMDARL